MRTTPIKSTSDLSVDEWAVLQAANLLLKRGQYPTGDRLCAALEDYPEGFVRRTRQYMVLGRLIAANPDRKHVEPDPEDFPADESTPLHDSRYGASPRKSGRVVDSEAWEFNMALFRIAQGDGSVTENLAVVTGMTEQAVAARIKRVRHECPDHPVAKQVLSNAELGYLERRYMKHADRSVQQWVGTLHSAQRKRPDWRTASDAEAAA